MDLQEVMKKVVSLENQLVLQAKEIELQSNEIKSLKQILSRNINNNPPQQPAYLRQSALGQENLQHNNNSNNNNNNTNKTAIAHHLNNANFMTRQPRRYSREFLNNVRYSTGANYSFSTYTMNPVVHPPTAIPPVNVPAPMVGIINMQPPPIATAANIIGGKTNSTHHSFKLKPPRLHVPTTSLQPSLPVTSNGRFEPSISINGFKHDEQEPNATTRKQDARQSLIEKAHNDSTTTTANPIPPARPLPVNPLTTTPTPSQPEADTKRKASLKPSKATIVDENVGADSEMNQGSKPRPNLKPRENDDPCRCPILYSIIRNNPSQGVGDNLDLYLMDELTTEEPSPAKQEGRMVDPRVEKVRLIHFQRDEKTQNYRSKFINEVDGLDATKDVLTKSTLKISNWPCQNKVSSSLFSSSTTTLKSNGLSPKKKAIKLNISSKFTIEGI